MNCGQAMATRTGGMVPTLTTVIPYSTAAETLNSVAYTAAGTNNYATTFESFYKSVAATTTNVDTCALDKC